MWEEVKNEEEHGNATRLVLEIHQVNNNITIYFGGADGERIVFCQHPFMSVYPALIYAILQEDRILKKYGVNELRRMYLEIF